MSNNPESNKPDIKDSDIFNCYSIIINPDRTYNFDHSIILETDMYQSDKAVTQCYVRVGGYIVPFIKDPKFKDATEIKHAHLIWDNGYGIKVLKGVTFDDLSRTPSKHYYLIRIRAITPKEIYGESVPHAIVTGDRKYLNATGYDDFPGWIISQDIVNREMIHVDNPDDLKNPTSIVGLYLVKANAVISINPYSGLYYPGLNYGFTSSTSGMCMYPHTEVSTPTVLVNKKEESANITARINISDGIFGDMAFYARIISGGDEVEILSFPERIISGGNPQIPMPVIPRYESPSKP